MRGILVAIDLETTGLDAADSHIIEIGAAKFRENEIIETFTTLVDPGVPIPPRVTDITGIKTESLAGAPKIAEVLPTLSAFADNAPIVGHNVEFDLRFLRKQGLFLTNPGIDTYELASVLLPTASRYNLNALMQMLNIAPEGAYHRALTDAIASVRLYMALWRRLIHDLPYELLREISAMARDQSWGGRLPFEAALRVRDGERGAKDDPVMRAFKPLERKPAPIVSNPGVPLLISEPGETGLIATTLANGEKLLLETPAALTYLRAAAYHALRSGERVVVAVASENSRRTIIEHEIPKIRAELDALSGVPLEVTILRRRADYLCPAGLAAMRNTPPETTDDLRVLAKTLIWLGQGGDANSNLLADTERLSIRGPGEQAAYARLTAEPCTRARCEVQMGEVCPLYRDRLLAEGAHLVIVAPEMLLADRQSRDPIIPPYQHVIVDEAHTLEDASTEGLHIRYDAHFIKRLVVNTSGQLTAMLVALRPVLPEKTFTPLAGGTSAVIEALDKMVYHIDNLFRAMQSFLEAEAKPSDFAVMVRLSDDVRHKPTFGQVRAAWSILGKFTAQISDVLGQLNKRLAALREKFTLPPTFELEAAERDFAAMHRWLDTCLAETPDPRLVNWAEVGKDYLVLHSGPLSVAESLRKLWESVKGVVLSDFTLRVGGTFDYLRGRLGAENFETVAPDQDAEQPLLLYVPSNMPEPSAKDYQKSVERGIIGLAMAIEARLVVLFTSHAQLRQASQHIVPRLALGNIPVFDQSDGTSIAGLLEGYRSSERGVLLGVRGFWEDAGLTEQDLTGLVIVRLPFPVPTDPIFAARSETFDDPLNQYTIPHTILRFRQSVERLMRGRATKGVILLLDKRILSKDYGELFLQSLPPGTVVRAVFGELAASARDWLGLPPIVQQQQQRRPGLDTQEMSISPSETRTPTDETGGASE
jgi:ATP-dependent DNA helicase DinG